MAFEAYSVAIKLSLNNMVSSGLAAIAKDVTGLERNVVNLQEKFNALKMIGAGWGIKHVGDGMLGFLSKSVDVSKEYTRQMSLMNAAGMSQLEIAKATGAAWATSKEVVTSSAAANLEAIRELRSVFGKDHMDEAYSILPTVQRTKSILEALTGKEQHGVAFDMVKAIELRTSGTMTAERMQSNADQMAKTLLAMGGTLTVNDFHMALKQAKTSAFGLSDDFVYKYLPTFMQEVKTKEGGAQSAGTALMTTYQALIGGKLKKSSIPLWEAMGLINPGDVVKNATGQMQLKPGAVKDSQLLQSNPYEWANKVLAPAIENYGKKTGLNREQVLSGMFGDRNAQWMMNTLIGKAPQFERDAKLVDSTPKSYEAYQKLLQSNPQLAQQALHSQWENVQARLGYEVLPKLIPLMIKFADWLDGIAQWMEKHGTMLTVIVVGLGGLGIALDLIGRALMTAGLIKFLGLGPGLKILGGKLGGLVGGLNDLTPKLSGMADGLKLVTKAAGVFMAAYAGWEIGGWLNDKNSERIKKESGGQVGSLGDLYYQRMHHGNGSFRWQGLFSTETGSEALARQKAEWNAVPVPPRQQQMVQVKSVVMLDKRQIAEATTEHQARELSRAPTGAGRYDTAMGMLFPGMSSAVTR